MEREPARRVEPVPSLLPAPEHIAYLANLLTVLAVLFGAFYVWRQRKAKRRVDLLASGRGYA